MCEEAVRCRIALREHAVIVVAVIPDNLAQGYLSAAEKRPSDRQR
jgi:hypothetical protein